MGLKIESRIVLRLGGQREVGLGRGEATVSDVYWERCRQAPPSNNTHTVHIQAQGDIRYFPVLISWKKKGLRSAGICLNFFLPVSHTPFVSVWFDTRPPPPGGHTSSIYLLLLSPDPRQTLAASFCLPVCPSLDIHKSISQFHFIQSKALMDFCATVLI